MSTKTAKKAGPKTKKALGLLERLAVGPVICAEGYLFEFERRGYLQAGAFVPEVVLEHPDLVEPPPRLRARRLGRGRGVHVLCAPGEASDHWPGAGSRAYQPDGAPGGQEGGQGDRHAPRGEHLQHEHLHPEDPKSHQQARRISTSRWAGRWSRSRLRHRGDVPSGGEALLALEAISDREAGRDHPCGSPREPDARGLERRRGLPAARGCRCGRGRPQLLPRSGDHAAAVEQVRAAVSATWPRFPCPTGRRRRADFLALTDPDCSVIPDGRAFPVASIPSCATATRSPSSGRRLRLGVRYLGVCCGAGPHHSGASRKRSVAARPRAASPRHVEAHRLRNRQAAPAGQSCVRHDVPATLGRLRRPWPGRKGEPGPADAPAGGRGAAGGQVA